MWKIPPNVNGTLKQYSGWCFPLTNTISISIWFSKKTETYKTSRTFMSRAPSLSHYLQGLPGLPENLLFSKDSSFSNLAPW